jgi:acetylornithine deacetylase/succinyl-diaminopimelate desuccinylase-like protein
MKRNLTSIETLQHYFQQHKQAMLNEYFKFLKFQSVSSEPGFIPQVNACAKWLVDYLKEMGFETQLWPTKGHPTIFASDLRAGPDKPTLLIYHHYDVQPVDPLNEWLSPPFEPTIRDGQVFARGAQDNKGQCFFTLQALKALLNQNKQLPINIKLCIEGEEECGSEGLAAILSQKQEELKADYLAVIDVGLREPNVPAVTIGVRGLVTMDVSVQCTHSDLHSGFHGGLSYNPIHALVELLSGLRDSSGKVTIPGFYDAVKPVNEREKELIALSFNEQEYEKIFGAKPTGGEKAFSPRERVWLRPTIEINGIVGGYSGSGFKTVIPAKASAKLSCRLVPDQDPEKIGVLVAKFLEKRAPEGTRVHVTVRSGFGKALRANPESKVAQAFSIAYRDVFQKPCEFIFEGGSIPIIPELAAASHSEVVLVGLGLSDDHIHAPNEHFGLDRLEQGFLVIARAIELLDIGELI